MSYTEYSQVPWFRKGPIVAVLWLLLTPVGVVLMWSGDVYYNKVKDGKLVTMPVYLKVGLTAVMVMFIVQAFVRSH